MIKKKKKMMIIIVFYSRGIVQKEFLLPEQKVNHVFCKDIMELLRKRVQRVRKDIADDWVL